MIEIEMRRGEAGLYSPVGHPGAAVGKGRSDGPSHVAFWLRPVSLFGRFGVTSPASLHVRSAFHVSPGRAPPRGWQGCRRCPRSFTPWVTPQHVRVGAPKHHRVRPGCPDRHSNLDPCNIPPRVCSKVRMFLVARRVAGQALRPAQPPQNRTCRFPRIRLKHRPASSRSTAGTVRDGTSGGRERGSYLRWRGRGAPRCWCCRPARGPDPLCRHRASPRPCTSGDRRNRPRIL